MFVERHSTNVKFIKIENIFSFKNLSLNVFFEKLEFKGKNRFILFLHLFS